MEIKNYVGNLGAALTYDDKGKLLWSSLSEIKEDEEDKETKELKKSLNDKKYIEEKDNYEN